MLATSSSVFFSGLLELTLVLMAWVFGRSIQIQQSRAIAFVLWRVELLRIVCAEGAGRIHLHLVQISARDRRN